MSLIYGILITAFSYVAARQLSFYAIAKQMFMDVPNARSSHTRPTPRCGGMAMAGVFILSVLMLVILGKTDYYRPLALALGGGAVAVLGVWDDLRPLDIRKRLAVQGGAALFFVAAIGGLPHIIFYGDHYIWAWLATLIGIVAMVWYINFYNFMDGIDGMAAFQALFVSAAMMILFASNQLHDFAALSGVLFCVMLGFTLLNYPPAKLFMGDVGSGFLGFVFAALSFGVLDKSTLSVWPFLVLMTPFIVDTTYTLVQRARRGEKVYVAHRQHAYQIISRFLGSHKPVIWWMMFLNVVWYLPLSLLAAVLPEVGIVIFMIGAAPMVLICSYFKAGTDLFETSTTAKKR